MKFIKKIFIKIKDRNKKKNTLFLGFTLIELMVVIVILGVLVSTIIPRISNMQERARDTANKSNINNIAQALDLYNLENGTYPLSTAGSTECISINKFGSTAYGSVKTYLKGERVPAPYEEQTWSQQDFLYLNNVQCDDEDGPSYIYFRAQDGYAILSKIHNKGNANASLGNAGAMGYYFPEIYPGLTVSDFESLYGAPPEDKFAIYIQTGRQ